jgi:hypothetical protein
MAELDLSFVVTQEEFKKQKQDSARVEQVRAEPSDLDLSFLVTKQEYDQQQSQRKAIEQPAERPADNRGLFQKARDFVTGADRETDQTRNLPELHNSGLLAGTDTSTLKGLGLGSAALTTLDTNELADIISSTVPEIVKVENKDAQGNIIPILVNQKTGASTVINKPGLSKMDFLQGTGLAFLFAGAGASNAAAGVGRKMLVTGAKSGLRQAAIEAGQAAGGGEFNPSDVAAAGIGGGLFEGVAHAFGRALPHIRRSIASGNISNEVRRRFAEEAQRFGIPEEQVTDDLIRQWADRIDDRTGLEREFGVTLTRGQRSGDQALLSQEDNFRAGLKGDKAQTAFLGEEAKQLQNLNNAAGQLQDDISRGSQLITNRNDAGAAIRQGVQNAERVADDAITQAYNEVGDAALSPEGFKELIEATKKATTGIKYPKDKELVPAHNALIKKLDSIGKFVNAKGSKLKPIHIKQIESLRQSINAYAGAAANPTDARNVSAIKKSFDGYLDDAVIRGMFDGDAESLAALKNARSVTREYFKKFGLNTKTTRLGTGKDPAGTFVTKIILENPTDEQVVNSLWAASGFNKQAAAKMAQRYKSILGPDSDEWNQVRQAAFDQLIAKKTINGQQYVDGARTATNLLKAKDQGRSLLNELFTSDELQKIGRFATLAKRAAPELVRSRENPSGTAQKLLSSIRGALPFVDGGYSVVANGGIILRNRGAANAARSAFRPFRNTTIGGRFARGAATGQAPHFADVAVPGLGQAQDQ